MADEAETKPKKGPKDPKGTSLYMGQLRALFDAWDANKDGYLDKQELRRAVERLRQARAAARGKAAQGAAPAGPRPDFDALDRDADGRLTRDEVKGSPLADQFDRIDTNKDGQIDRKEFEAYLKKQAGKKRP
jgi:Ca2+-binding EF-hand superfamily protein